jgi:hypothetical protein
MAGRTNHPERLAHLASARINVAGFGIGETFRLDGSKKTPKNRVLFLPFMAVLKSWNLPGGTAVDARSMLC